MATVSEAIGALISSVQSAAATNVGVVNNYSYNMLTETGLDSVFRNPDGSLVLGEPPTVGTLPASSFMAPTDLLTMLDSAKTSLQEIGGQIPDLADIINLTDSVALDKFVSYLASYRAQLVSRAATIIIPAAPQYPMAGQVRAFSDDVPETLSPALSHPAFAVTGFTNTLRILLGEAGELSYQRALAAEKIINAGVQAKIDVLTARRAILEVQALLDFSGAAMSAAIAIIRKTIVSPEEIVKLFSQLSQARTKVATGLAANRAAYAGTYMEYVNAVVGYYELFAELEKVRFDAEGLTHTMDATDNEIKAAQLAGAAAASAHAAAAGYSAVRVGVVLTDKAFS